jgi:hypothetical protein
MECGSLTDLLSAIGTFFLGIVALFAIFYPTIRSHRRRPLLDIEVSMEPPDWDLMPIIGLPPHYATDSHAWYSRLLIKNEGEDPARNVFVRVKSISRQLPDSTFERVTNFLPMNLRWANTETVYFERVYRDVPVHCNFGRILNPAHREFPYEYSADDKVRMAFSLCLEGYPSNLSHLLWPGTYSVSVVVAAENAEPKECVFEIFLSNENWDKDREPMKERVRIGKSLSL